MKVFLMHREKDFDPKQPLPWNEGDLIQDLGMNPLLNAMGGRILSWKMFRNPLFSAVFPTILRPSCFGRKP